MSLNDFLVTETVNSIFGRVESTMEEVSNTYRKIEKREKEVIFTIIEESITNESDKKAVLDYIKGLEKKTRIHPRISRLPHDFNQTKRE